MDSNLSTRRAQTRERLMVAAKEVFARKGIQASSVEEICEVAGFTRGAFYSNFESRDDLCLSVLKAAGHQVVAAVHQAIASVPVELTGQGADQLVEDAVAVFMASQPPDAQWVVVRSELRLHALRHPQLREALAATEDEIRGLIGDALDTAIRLRGGSVSLPIRQFLVVLDAYCERESLAHLQRGSSVESLRWAEGLSALVRSLVTLPEDDRAPGRGQVPVDQSTSTT